MYHKPQKKQYQNITPAMLKPLPELAKSVVGHLLPSIDLLLKMALQEPI
jgi:hypothetical protein